MTAKAVALQRLLARLPSDVLARSGAIEDCRSSLFDPERRSIESAVERRQIEFATGRHLARKLLQTRGVTPTPILRGKAGEPLWPAGFCGSISHSGETCVVAIAPADAYAGIGIDIEYEQIQPEATDLVMTPDELARFDTPTLARLAFGAKEAFYKAVAGLHGELIDFHDVEIHIDGHARTFRVETQTVDRAFVQGLIGLYDAAADASAVACLLPRPAA